jgi:putative DNA primase/helicase
MVGDGANGKGTLLNLLLRTLGDYADAADPELLTARTFDAHPTGTADLIGRRLAVLHEGEQGRRLAEGLVKRLTGGDRIKARRMREDFWSFEPSHTFVMLTNHKPIVLGQDGGIWRRLQIVPWEVVVPEDERDGHLGDRLALEVDAVLARLVAGYQAWRHQGLNAPEKVLAATEEFRKTRDTLGRFIDDRCSVGAALRVRSAQLFTAWSRWCATEGEESGTATAFAALLQNRGFDKRKTNIGAVWSGLALRQDGDG